MTEIKKELISLLKYPVIAITIIASLCFSEWLFNLDFSRISHVGPDGLSFIEKSQTRTSAALSEIESRLNEALARISDLENGIKDTFVGKSIEEVSDLTAKLSKSFDNSGKTILKGQSGYIFLGYTIPKSSKFLNKTLKQHDSMQDIDWPDKLSLGSEYVAQGNLVLRDGIPPNTKEYYHERSSLGVVPKGTVVKLIDKPVGIKRSHATEYWGKVEVKQ